MISKDLKGKKVVETSKPKLASNKKDVMVEQNKDGKWVVRTTGSLKALKLFDTQNEAAQYGKDLAMKNATEIRVKNTSGKVRQKTSYRK